MKPKFAAWMLLSLLAVSLSACNRGALRLVADSGATQSQSTVEVQNKHWEDVTIYVVRASTPLRLGIVSSNTTRAFKVPQGYVGAGMALQLRAETRVSRESFTSMPFDFSPGRQAQFVVEGSLNRSNLVVW